MAKVQKIQKGIAPRRGKLFDLVEDRRVWLEVPGYRPFKSTHGDVVASRYARVRRNESEEEPEHEEADPQDPRLVWDPPFWAEEHEELKVFRMWVGPDTAEAGLASGVYRPGGWPKAWEKKGRAGKAPLMKDGSEKVFVAIRAGSVSLFTNTSKMSCGSYSLPAGAVSIGGSCPTATTMDVVAGYDKAAFDEGRINVPKKATILTLDGGTFPRKLPMLKSDEPAGAIDSQRNICNSCYAAKGNYGNANAQVYQILRYAWTVAKVREKTFVDEMSTALDAFFGSARTRAARDQSTEYFRLHDSGDFFAANYLDAWAAVAANFPKVKFWAPTRVWMLPNFLEHIEAARETAPNLVIRPSSLQFDDPAPMVAGLAAGSTAMKADGYDALAPAKVGLAHWDCPAYALATKSCAGAMDLSNIKDQKKKGKVILSSEQQRAYLEDARANFEKLFGRKAPIDCRVCWDQSEASISYHAH